MNPMSRLDHFVEDLFLNPYKISIEDFDKKWIKPEDRGLFEKIVKYYGKKAELSVAGSIVNSALPGHTTGTLPEYRDIKFLVEFHEKEDLELEIMLTKHMIGLLDLMVVEPYFLNFVKEHDIHMGNRDSLYFRVREWKTNFNLNLR